MTKKQIVSKVIKYIGKYKYLLIISLILSVFCVGVSLYIPVLAGNAIDCIISKDSVNFDKIINYVFRIIILAICSALMQWIINTLNNKISFNTVKDLRNDAVSKITKLPLSYIDTHTSGEIVSRVISDADQLADGLLLGFTQFFTGVLTIIGTLAFMLKINWKITPVVVLLTPLSLFVARFIANKTHSKFQAQTKARGNQTAHIEETIYNAKTVRAYNYEQKSIEEFEKINDEFAKNSLKAIFYSSITNPSTRFVNNMIYAVVGFTGAMCVISPNIAFTIGNLTCFLSYSGQYAKPFNEISGVIAELQNAIACAERILEIIDEKEITEKPYASNISNAEGNIKISNLNFSYSNDKKLIENLNLDAPKCTQIAIVGPTGCGKTTVINLLMRFYDPDSGTITLDDVNIQDITRKSLRSNYGMVLQETWIKTGTVKENIAIGKPDATDEDIITAAKEAHAHSFIKRLPQGYDTVISDDISGLSQGQKQLLCIARIMLIMPPVVILDEATSSIDTRTELKIREAFAKITKGKTSFVVAHRLSTIKNSDIILVMNDGKIIEQGNHNELMAKHGFYEKLYNSRVY